MAAKQLRLKLTSLNFPLLMTDRGTSSFIASYDQAEGNIQPQPIWVENLVPTAQGYKSVGYSNLIDVPYPEIITNFNPSKVIVKLLQTLQGATVIVMQYDSKLLVYTARLGIWKLLVTDTPLSPDDMQIVQVKDSFFFFNRALGLKKFNLYFDSLESVELKGLLQTQIDKIASINNYLIAFINNAVYWSTPTDLLEFSPIIDDITTGAGSTNIRDLKGTVTYCVETDTALIIYTNLHAISMRFTGNTANPWTFSEVANSHGLSSTTHVTANRLGNVYAWTSAGLQTFNETEAVNVFPDVSDFLKKGKFERRENITASPVDIVDDAALVTTLFKLLIVNSDSLNIAINYVSGRYLCISYGESSYEFILLYDTALGRWGKLRVDHLAVLDSINVAYGATLISDLVNPISSYTVPIYTFDGDTATRLPSPNSFTILNKQGIIVKVDLANTQFNEAGEHINSGLFVFGDLRLVRMSLLHILEVCTNTASAECLVALKTSFKNYADSLYSVGLINEYDEDVKLFNVAGASHELALYGDINLTDLVISYMAGGSA